MSFCFCGLDFIWNTGLDIIFRHLGYPVEVRDIYCVCMSGYSDKCHPQITKQYRLNPYCQLSYRIKTHPSRRTMLKLWNVSQILREDYFILETIQFPTALLKVHISWWYCRFLQAWIYEVAYFCCFGIVYNIIIKHLMTF